MLIINLFCLIFLTVFLIALIALLVQTSPPNTSEDSVIAKTVHVEPLQHAIEYSRGEYLDSAKKAGDISEAAVRSLLINNFNVPTKQILRNVYIPVGNGGTTEIDVLVVSKKGLLIFECKNYGGNIYGDVNMEKWIQYIGKQKNYFYNPFKQNKTHVKYLKKFLQRFGDVPVIPFVAVSARGKWAVRKMSDDDYLLGYNCQFAEIYGNLPNSAIMEQNFNDILNVLCMFSSPEKSIRDKHIQQVISHKEKAHK